MTPERIAALVARWVRLYTRGVPTPIAQRRIEEIDADLRDHLAHERAHGTGERRIALSILSRMIRGVAADAAWRGRHAGAAAGRPTAPEDAMTTHRTTYRSAVGVAVAAAFLLVWLSLGVGVIGKDGDRANLMYAGVLAVGIIGAVIARRRPHGMARALLATAAAQAVVAVIALAAGLGRPWSGPSEIVLLNGFFVALFAGSALLFRHAARSQPPRDTAAG